MKVYIIFSLLYGAFILGSGVYRFYVSNSTKALWFGLVMGSIALLSGVLAVYKKPKSSLITQFIVVLFVGGFFINKIIGGLEGDSYLRVIILISLSVAMGFVVIKEWLGSKIP